MKKMQKILHIDDDAVMRMMTRKALERSNKGFEIVSCSVPDEFLSALSDFKPDLLIIDVLMPQKKGPDLLSDVRKFGYKIPAVFMTGQDSGDFETKKNLDPVIGIIQKPFSTGTLGEDLLGLWDAYRNQY